MGGRPLVAEQFIDKSSTAILLIDCGGFVMNFGTEMTTSEVTADASPKWFFAWHT